MPGTSKKARSRDLKMHRAERRAERQFRYRRRTPIQPDGSPSGKHLTGFKGMKVSEQCFCGGCNPNAKINARKPVFV